MKSPFFRVGDKVSLTALLLVYYDINTNLAYMRRGSGEDVVVPLSMAEFELGMYGVSSRVHPTNLPTNHPDFCLWVDKNKRLVRHKRTGELCLLELDSLFYATGTYKMRPKNSVDPKTRTAPIWTGAQARLHLDSLKGTEYSFKVRITSILYRDNLVTQILLNKVTSDKVMFVVTSLEWDTFFIANANLINTYL